MTRIDVKDLSSREGAQHLAKQVGGDFLFDGGARRNAAIAQRVAPLASRNGKVDLPALAQGPSADLPQRSAGLLGTLFLGRARRHIDIGP